MANFGEDLNRLLKMNGLAQERVCRFISEATANTSRHKNPAAVKEQLRQNRLKGLEAFEYPYFDLLVKCFDANGHKKCASRLRAVYASQSSDRGLTQDATANIAPKQLSFLKFPRNDPQQKIEEQLWRESVFEGDVDLYRSSLALFYGLAGSWLHAPIRKAVAIDLARAAITYGDYRDAYIIATRYERAFTKYYIHDNASGASQGLRLKLNREDTMDYFRSLQMKALAYSYIMFFAPVSSSSQLFLVALKRAKKFFEQELLSFEDYQQIMIECNVRKLRVATRSAWAGTGDQPQQETLLDQANLLATFMRENPALPNSLRYICADTIARAYSLVPTLSSLEKADTWLTSARDLDDRISRAHGKPSNLRAYHEAVTNFLLLCSNAKLKIESSEGLRSRMETHLHDLVRAFGADLMWHSKLTLLSLKDFAFRILAEHRTNQDHLFDRFAPSEVLDNLDRETKQRLDQVLDQVEEIYFGADAEDEEHQICLRHMML